MLKLGNGELHATILMQRQIRDARFPDCCWVFSHDGKRIRDFRKSWRTACRRANMYFVGADGRTTAPIFHDLRRTAARNLRRAGVPERVIMLIGGWKTRSVFERYNIVDETDLQDAAIRLDKLPASEIGRSTVKAEHLPQEATALIN